MSLPLTGSQTVGPYFAIGLDDLCTTSVGIEAGAETVVIEGSLVDSEGNPIPDGFLEIWQADAQGRYSTGQPASSSANAIGFGRISTSPGGRFRFATVKPGAVPYDADRMQAPHLLVLVYMRGMLRNLVTRVYFPYEPANLTDPVLQLVPAERRHTLIAGRAAEPGTLHWDILVRDLAGQDGKETVFFAW